MWNNTSNLKGKLFTLFMLVCFSWVSLSAQETIGGKLVRTGTWEGRQVEYLEGEIAIILKPGEKSSRCALSAPEARSNHKKRL